MTWFRAKKRVEPWAALLAAAVLLLVPDRALSVHGRYWNLSWNPDPSDPSNRTIIFHFQYAWATGFYFGDNIVGNVINTDIFTWGDATPSIPIPTQILSTNIVQGWSFAQGVRQVSPGVYVEGLRHTYATNGTFLANVDSCCRWLGLQNAFGGYRVETNVNAGSGNSSPVVSLPPIIQVMDNTVATFPVPAVDPNSDTLTFRLATLAESALSPQPPALTVNATTGMVSWDITAATNPTVVGGQFWCTQVFVEDRDGAGNVKSKSPVDFIMQVVVPGANSPPVFEPPTPSLVNGPAGVPLSFRVQASDINATDTVVVGALNPPIGMTVTPVPAGPSPNPNANAVQVNWTPPTAGTVIVIFQATDAPGGLTTFHAVTINGPNVPPPPPTGDEGSFPKSAGPTGSEGSFGGRAGIGFSPNITGKYLPRLLGPLPGAAGHWTVFNVSQRPQAPTNEDNVTQANLAGWTMGAAFALAIVAAWRGRRLFLNG